MNFRIALWLKAYVIAGLNASLYRADFKGRVIAWQNYGDRDSEYGWEGGHIQAKCEGGSDDLCNLQPEHWKTNLEKEETRKCLEKFFAPSLRSLAGLEEPHYMGLQYLASMPLSQPLATPEPAPLSYSAGLDAFINGAQTGWQGLAYLASTPVTTPLATVALPKIGKLFRNSK